MALASIGIVGLGYWGPHLLRNFAGLDECSVKYGCDLLQANLEKMRKNYPAITYTKSYDDLLKDSDLTAIVIATPTVTHFPLAKAAMEAGKHVLLEKPMTSSAAEASELVNSKEIGELHYFDSTRINLGLIQKDVNVLWDLAIHDLSILSVLHDLSRLKTLYAHGSTHFTQQPEIAHLHLTFKDGVEAHIHVSWLSPVKIRRTILGGSKKMILYDDTEPSEKIRIYDKGVHFQELIEEGKPDPFFPIYRSGDILIPAIPNPEAMHVEAEHFLACIEGRETPRVSGEDGFRIVKILELANQSMMEKRPLAL